MYLLAYLGQSRRYAIAGRASIIPHWHCARRGGLLDDGSPSGIYFPMGLSSLAVGGSLHVLRELHEPSLTQLVLLKRLSMALMQCSGGGRAAKGPGEGGFVVPSAITGRSESHIRRPDISPFPLSPARIGWPTRTRVPSGRPIMTKHKPPRSY